MNGPGGRLHTARGLGRRLAAVGLTAALTLAALLAGPAGAAEADVPMAGAAGIRPADPPVLAYYYIWFTPTSWQRAKTDEPLLGRYASEETSVMRQHVRWAKAAGIDGFVVSWKHTADLDARLERLIEVAEEEHFGLAVIYQGLDFERRPLPADRVAVDLDFFIRGYAGRAPFHIFAKPLVVWSGTWEFSSEDVARVTAPRRDQLLVLASERNVAGYNRLAGFVDGDAYYWSSVNPETYRNYKGKLSAMSEAVRAAGGLWIAPVAPGFDARLIGGHSVVARRDGDTLRRQWDAAVASAPDAIGLISWNEFSENSHVEPSRRYGRRYLEVVADITGAPPLGASDFDSSGPEGRSRHARQLPLLAGFGALFTVCAAVAAGRARKDSPR